MVTMRMLTASLTANADFARARHASKPFGSKPSAAVTIDRWFTITRRPSEASP